MGTEMEMHPLSCYSPRKIPVLLALFLGVPELSSVLLALFLGVPELSSVLLALFLGVLELSSVLLALFLGVPELSSVLLALFLGIPELSSPPVFLITPFFDCLPCSQVVSCPDFSERGLGTRLLPRPLPKYLCISISKCLGQQWMGSNGWDRGYHTRRLCKIGPGYEAIICFT